MNISLWLTVRLVIGGVFSLVKTEDNLEDNVAKHKYATQSSEYHANNKWTASKAVDGSLYLDIYGSSCSHTSMTGTDPWWKVDLLHSLNVSGVTLYRRADRCPYEEERAKICSIKCSYPIPTKAI